MKIPASKSALFKSFPLIQLFSFFAVASLADDAPTYRSRVWQTDEGLPHNSVQAISQSADGYLWVGTADGLARFDGVRFTTMDERIHPDLRGLWIINFCESRDGSLWIATDGKGLIHLKEKKFSRLTRADGLPSESLRALCETRDGSLWIGSSNAGLFRYRAGKFFQIAQKDGLSSNTVRSVCEDQEGNLWVATGEGLDCLRNEKIIARYNATNGLPHNSIRVLLLDHAGALWIGSNGGLTRKKDGKFFNYSVADGLLDATVSSLYEDHKGTLWVGTYGGLNRLTGGKLVSEMGNTETFLNVVYAIFEDREENIWIGSRAGLSRLNSRRFSALNKQQGLTHNSTVSVLEDKTGSLWIGTWGGALNQLKDGKMNFYAASPVIPITLILALHEDHNGGLWIGTDYDGGVYRFKDGIFRRWGKEHGMSEIAVGVIYEDRQKNVWIGARTGLTRLRDENLFRYGVNDGLPAAPVKVIAEDNDDNLWVGTADGLCRFRENKFETFSRRDGLSSSTILALHEDSEKNFWIGTKGGGLNRIQKVTSDEGRVARKELPSLVTRHSSQPHFTAYTTKEGLAFDDVFEIVEDDFGNFWMSCGKGIFRVSKKEFGDFDRGKISRLNCVAYGKADGMVSIDCKGVAKPAGCKSKDGRLWFPTDKGLVVVDATLKNNEKPPSVVIEEIFADGKEVSELVSQRISEGKSTHSITHSLTHNFTIPPGRGELQVHYTALSFQAPEKNCFRYKLEGADRDWTDVGPRRVAYYNNLSPGTYRFQVIACNNDGIWNETGASVDIILQPQFWQSWWFNPAVALAFGGLLFGVYRLRVARAREIERLRLRIAADLHDEVGSSLWSISLLSRMLQKEELKTEQKKDVSEINRIAVQTANSIRDIVWFINPEYDTLQDLLLRMKDVANTTLGGIEWDFQQPHENLSRKLPLNFRQNIFLMFKEILTNVIKHSHATHVEIKISETAECWQMRISDNGRGFDTAALQNGNGLKNLRRRAEKLGAELEIRSQPGQGTTIIVSTKAV